MSESVVLRGERLTRRFGDTHVLRGVSLELCARQSMALLGPSGCGKTTLLQILGGLDRPESGTVELAGQDLFKPGVSARVRARVRLRSVGFVFQRHNLLEHLSARDNVALLGWHAGMSRAQALAEADRLLERFALTSRRAAKAVVLSPGEAQRVAIARALINRPAVVLADEPTGALDSAASAIVADALFEVCQSGAALLVVTHEPALAERFERRAYMMDGVLQDEPVPGSGP